MTTPTPGQTVGPFFHLGMCFPGLAELVPPTAAGARRLHGRVLDGAGAPVPDAVLEIWQCRPDGSAPAAGGSFARDGWSFTGWGRAATDPDGRYSFSTLAPGAAPGTAAFFAVTVFARGLLDHLRTRAYLPEQAELDSDPLLRRLTPDLRRTLLADATDDGWRFDVRLQGPGETVFLDGPRQDTNAIRR